MSELPANSEENRESPAARLARLAALRPSSSPETQPAPEPVNPAGQPPDERRCTGIVSGRRCGAWAVKGESQCAGHLGIGIQEAQLGSRKAAEARREARQSVRARAATALDEDFDDVLAALRRGIKQDDPAKAAKAASDYVSLVYGRQLQKPDDEKPEADPLDVASLTREERDQLKRQLVSEHPELAARLRVAG